MEPIFNILQYPDPRLKQKAHPVTTFDQELKAIVDKMFRTHYAQEHCAALAATQLDMPHPPHITVIDFSEEKNKPLCLVNAQITEKEGTQTAKEGCMSVGGKTYKAVTRAQKITVEAFDASGKPLTITAEGFMARCIQHELDHLNGILFIDHLKPLQRKLLDSKLLRLLQKRTG
jgi:peptide deformylase